MPKRAAKLATSAKPATATAPQWLDLLPELWAEIWRKVISDRFGNPTIPGMVFDCRRWRLVCKQFRALSQTTPLPFDATIWFSGVNQPALFKGGLAYGKERRCRLLRHARSGQVFFVTCMPDSDRKGYQQTLKKWSLPDLVACLGAHNADYKTRLRDLEQVVSGFPPGIPGYRVRNYPEVEGVPVVVDDRGATIETIYQEGPNTPMHRRGYTSRDYVTSMVETTEEPVGFARKHRRGAGLAFCATFFDSQSTHTVEACEAVPATTDDGVEHAAHHFSWVHPHGVHPLVVACGMYDLPDIAECDGWVVSLLKHGLRKGELVKLVERHENTTGDIVHRIMAASALKRHERAKREEEARQREEETRRLAEAKRQRALAKRKPKSASPKLVVRGGVPVSKAPKRTIATSRPKRRAARAAGPLIAEYARIDQVTLPNGQFTHEQQQADADSLEDAADGWVDDQYAAEGDDEDQEGNLSGSQDEQSEDDDWDPDANDESEREPPASAAASSSSSAHLSMDELRAQRLRHFQSPA